MMAIQTPRSRFSCMMALVVVRAYQLLLPVSILIVLSTTSSELPPCFLSVNAFISAPFPRPQRPIILTSSPSQLQLTRRNPFNLVGDATNETATPLLVFENEQDHRKQQKDDEAEATATATLENEVEQSSSIAKGDEQPPPVEQVAAASSETSFASDSATTTTTPSSFFSSLSILGIPITPEIAAIVTIYFVEGALGLARLAQSFLLKDQLHLGPAEMSMLSGILILPWTIKPLYGFLSDGFPLFGYQRKSYLILAGFLGALSYGILGYEPIWQGLHDTNNDSLVVTGTVTALLISSACIALSDVVADGIVVTRTREYANRQDNPAMAGSLQSLCWGSAAIGGLLSAYFSGSLLEIMSVRDIFGLTAILPFLVSVIALGVNEQPIVKNEENDTSLLEGVQEQAQTLWQALKQPAIWKPALFLFLWQSTPTADGAFFYFLTNDLQLGPEFLGRVRLVTAGAGLLGVYLYNGFFKERKIKDILFWSTIASFPLGMLPILLVTHVNREIGIPDTALIYGDDVALAALGQISFLPTLVLAARLCPPGVEAVLFATLMSIFNGAGTVGTEIGAFLTKWAGITESNFDNLAWLISICNVTSLWPLLLIGWLDGVGDVSENETEENDTRSSSSELEKEKKD